MAEYITTAILVQALIGAVVGSGVSIGISYAAQALVGKPPSAFSSKSIDNLKEITRSNDAPARVVYGRARVAGLLAFGLSTDKDGRVVQGGKFLHGLLVLSQGPIAGVREITLNDRLSTDPIYRNHVLFVVVPGFQEQEAITTEFHMGRYGSGSEQPLKRPEVWTEAHRLRGLAYVWFVMHHHVDVFPAGAPTVRSVVEGKLLYDPRDSNQNPYDETTWRWSDNLGLVIRDYVLSPTYGMGLRAADLDLDGGLELS